MFEDGGWWFIFKKIYIMKIFKHKSRNNSTMNPHASVTHLHQPSNFIFKKFPFSDINDLISVSQMVAIKQWESFAPFLTIVLGGGNGIKEFRLFYELTEWFL